jgi:Flp pilus assembly protein TadD
LAEMTQVEAERYSTLLRDGIALHQTGRLDEAAAIYARVLAKFPDHPDTLDLHGVLLHQAERNDEAVELLERAVRIRPDNAAFHNHLGVCQQALGRLEKARDSFTTARSLRPDMPEPAFNLATVLNQLALFDQAEQVARDAMTLAPNSIEARLALVRALGQSKRHGEAVEILRETQRSLPPDLRVLEQMARQYALRGETHAAGVTARRALVFQPNASSSYVFLSEPERMIEWARRAVHLAPQAPRLWANLSSHYNVAVENASSISAARSAMVLDPATSLVYLNMATCALRIFDFRLARKIAYRGMALDQRQHWLAICASECERSRGNIAKGWELYERRVLLSDALPRLGLPPAWDRTSSPAGPLLVCAEQGVGDEFIFLSCLPDVLTITNDVIVECDARCLPLFRRTFPTARWVPRSVREIKPGVRAWDYRSRVERLEPSAHILAASLPAFAKAGLGRPAIKGGYLRVDADEVTAWRSWLASLPDRPKVGISWRSGMIDALHADYYFTPEMLLEGIGADSATFISLLYTDASDEILNIRNTLGTVIHEPPGLYQRDELDRLAALISELDIVVTADTSVCAMAAACGVPTIRLEASYMLLANGEDAFFENIYPCRDTEVPFSRDSVLRRGSAKFKEWMDVLANSPGGKI